MNQMTQNLKAEPCFNVEESSFASQNPFLTIARGVRGFQNSDLFHLFSMSRQLSDYLNGLTNGALGLERQDTGAALDDLLQETERLLSAVTVEIERRQPKDSYESNHRAELLAEQHMRCGNSKGAVLALLDDCSFNAESPDAMHIRSEEALSNS